MVQLLLVKSTSVQISEAETRSITELTPTPLRCCETEKSHKIGDKASNGKKSVHFDMIYI